MEERKHTRQSDHSRGKGRRTARRGRKHSFAPAAFLRAIPEAIGAYFRRIGERTRTVVRETREKNFPESNRILVQLFLFLGAMIPYGTALLRERTSELGRRRRLQNDRRGGKRASGGWWSALRQILHARKKYHPLIFIGAAVVIVTVAGFFSRYTYATTVLYRGEPQGTVDSAREAKKVTAEVEALATRATGVRFEFAEDAIRYTHAFVPRSELCGSDELEEHLNDELGLVTYGYTLYINGENVGCTEYEGALESLLAKLKESYTSPDTLTIDFVEDVRIDEGYVPAGSIVNLGKIAELVNSTKAGEVTYTVERGDTWGKIALAHEMTNAELEALNPGFNINRLQIGDELLISNAVPYLTVLVTERQNYLDDVQYEIDYVDDSSMYQGDERVLSRGSYGTADVVADVTYVNGIEESRTILSSVTLSEPVTERRARGTKERPSWLPTGSFRWPCSGRITSYFGYRNTGLKGASTNHKGIDIAAGYGTSIVAADGGTVQFSGFRGAMGYVVIINHGNGYVTYYEHCSALLVKTGAKVYKGQLIARVGNSGTSYGAHCHFGIQRNGTYVNPLNYLP